MAVVGEVDIATADQLAKALRTVGATRRAVVRLDLAEISFCGCAGLRVLIEAYHAITATGGRLTITGARRPVRRLLQAAGCQWLLRRPADPWSSSLARSAPHVRSA